MTDQVLSGVKVLDLTHHIAGPYCSKLFADFGADVIKVERPGTGDPSRSEGPFPGDVAHPEKSGLFMHLNTNKFGVTLNLKSNQGIEILKTLAQDADIIIENFRPGVLQNLGIDYNILSQQNPRLILTHISNFGQSGPYKDYKATELTAFAVAARVFRQGEGDKPPVKYAGNVIQYLAGTKAASATMFAFFGAQFQGIGQEVDVSVQEILAGATDAGLTSYGYSSQIPHRADAPAAGFVSCADGFVQFRTAGGNPRMWNRLVQLLEMPELGEDSRFLTPALRMQNRDELSNIVMPWLMTQNKRDIAEKAQAIGLNATPVFDIGEVAEDRHNKERGFFVEIEHPVAGTFKYPGAPFKLQEGGWQIRRPAPLLGQHNYEIYQDKLGYTDQDISNLESSGVI